jgi:hypothetical protein
MDLFSGKQSTQFDLTFSLKIDSFETLINTSINYFYSFTHVKYDNQYGSELYYFVFIKNYLEAWKVIHLSVEVST